MLCKVLEWFSNNLPHMWWKSQMFMTLRQCAMSVSHWPWLKVRVTAWNQGSQSSIMCPLNKPFNTWREFQITLHKMLTFAVTMCKAHFLLHINRFFVFPAHFSSPPPPTTAMFMAILAQYIGKDISFCIKNNCLVLIPVYF